MFNGKAKCVQCHFGSNFTLNEFRNIGLFNSKNLNDSGRIQVTKNIEDLGRFKTASLVNVSVTAPYMHNGMFKTIRDVINYYNNPDSIVPNAINRDSLLARPLHPTENEKAELEAFLLSITDKSFILPGK